MPALADKVIPAYMWTEEIIKDCLDRDIPDISDIIVLSLTACLIFKGQHMTKLNEGFTMEDLCEILDRVNGGHTWAGKDTVVMALPMTLAMSHHILAKVHDFICSHRLAKLTGPRRVSLPKVTCPPPTPDTSA